MSITEFNAALNQVAAERGIPVATIIDSIKTALIAAYKKDYGGELEDISVDLDHHTGEAKIFLKSEDVTPAGFGRIAAQTARQVILQKIRETEKTQILKEFKEKIGTIVNGQVFRMENRTITLDLGKAHGVMPIQEQVQSETYRLNQKLKVLVQEIRETPKGTEIIVSRSDPKFIERLFEQEVPEIASKVVVIKAIAREAGARTKMAVQSTDEKVDPVGSCVGQKGVRVQAIINEVFGEKIDIIPFSNITEKFIAASLSPAKVTEVELDNENKKATVSVPEDQQSLAIGKEGQNARLANKLTKWKIDIKGVSNIFSDSAGSSQTRTDDKSTKVKGIWDDDIKTNQDAKKALADAVSDSASATAQTDQQTDIATDDTASQVVPDTTE